MVPPARFRALSLLALTAFVSACGGGQTRLGTLFSSARDAAQAAHLRRVERRLRNAPAPHGASVAVGATADGLVGVTLSGSAPWSFRHVVGARPIVAGNIVVGAGDHELFCLDATTGRSIWTRPIGGLGLIGAGDDGRTTVVTLASASGHGYTVLAVARDSTVVRQLETPEHLGRPAVVGGVAFVPWGERGVSAYDIVGGEEVGRITFATLTGHAFVEAGTLFFAGQAITRFDEQLAASGGIAAPSLRLPERDVLGSDRWLPPPTLLTSPIAGYADKVRAYARATSLEAPIGILDDTYYATYYRIVFGLHAPDAAMRWVYAHEPGTILAAAALRGGIALCDEAGGVTLVDEATGTIHERVTLGRAITSCAVQAGGFELEPARGEPPPFTHQLAEAIAMPFSELVPAQRIALARLAAEHGSTATKALRELETNPRVSPTLAPELARALATRPAP